MNIYIALMCAKTCFSECGVPNFVETCSAESPNSPTAILGVQR